MPVKFNKVIIIEKVGNIASKRNKPTPKCSRPIIAVQFQPEDLTKPEETVLQ